MTGLTGRSVSACCATAARRLFFVHLCALIGVARMLSHHVCQAEEISLEVAGVELRSAVAKWLEFSQANIWPHAEWKATIFNRDHPTEAPRIANYSTWARGDYCLLQSSTTVEGEAYQAFALVNPQYVAKIVRQGGESRGWRIQEVSLRDDERFDEVRLDLEGINKFARPLLLGPYTLCDLLADRQNYEIESATHEFAKPTGEIRRFVIALKPKLVVHGVDVAMTRLELSIAPAFQELPVSFVAHFEPSDGEAFERDENYSEWRNIGGRWYWGKYRWDNRISATGRVLPVEEVEANFDAFRIDDASDDAMKREQCWLKYYGLPEPQLGSGARRWWILVNILAVVLLATVVAFRRRQLRKMRATE